MKLKAISVRNFRSYANAKGEPPHKLVLGDGLNVLIGPNNCGKSNLLRAVALALQDSGGVDFSPECDIPSQLSWAYPIISLELSCDRNRSVEKRLLALVDDYERSAGAKKTYAEAGELTLRVTYRSTGATSSSAPKASLPRRETPRSLPLHWRNSKSAFDSST